MLPRAARILSRRSFVGVFGHGAFFIAAVSCGTLFFSAPASAATCTFASTEATNSFNLTANWSCGRVPDGGDGVVVPAATTTNILSGPVVVSSFSISGTLNIGSQLVTATSSFSVISGGVATSTSGTLTVSAGSTTTNAGSMGTNSGNFLFSGNVQNSGTFDIAAGNVTSTQNSVFTNSGTINGGTGVLAISKSFIDAGGTFNAQSGTVRTFHDGYVWVANAGTHNVSKIDPFTNSVVATTTVDMSPRSVVFDGHAIWTANQTSNDVTKIDPATNLKIATTTAGNQPDMMAFDGTYLWVPNQGGTDASVSKIDTTTGLVAATVGVGSAPAGAAFDGRYVWVANGGSSNVSKIDTMTNAVVATTTVGTQPLSIAFLNGYVWVPNNGSANISKIDPATNLVVATTTVNANPRGLAFDGTYIWVAINSAASVNKIDPATNLVVATTTVGTSPTGVVFDGQYLWVANGSSSNVSKIDPATGLVIATIGAGSLSRSLDFGGATSSLTIPLPGYTFNNIQIFNDHRDTISFAADASLTGTLVMASTSTLSTGAFNLTVTGATSIGASNTVTSTSGIINLSGAVTNNGHLGTSSGGIILGTSLANAGTFEIGSGSSTSVGTINNTGTVKGETGTLHIGGNWNNASGTFTRGTGTVALTGSNQSLTGSTSFYNLTKQTSATDTLTFPSGATTTITNTLILEGAASNLLSLHASVSGTQWYINPAGSRTLNYLSVQDSNNIASTITLNVANHSIDGGNNTNWTFDNIAPTVTLASSAIDPTNLSPFPVTSTFSEDVSGFTVSDITVSNGTASNFVTTTASSVYTFDITPASNGLVTVDIATSSASDAAGNPNDAAPRFSITFDTISPSTPSITPPAATYSSPITIAITSTGSNTVRYTLDGSDPTCSTGTLYAGLFILSSSATVKAVGCDLALNISSVATSVYTINTGTATNGGGGGTSAGSGSVYAPPVPLPTFFPIAPPPPAIPPTSPTVFVLDPSDLPTLLAFLGLIRDIPAEEAALIQVLADAKEFDLILTPAQATAMANFIAYGISLETIKFGSGERRAILRDYMETVHRADVVWSDLQRIATGMIPVSRNLTIERSRLPLVLKTFERIFGHRPNFQDPTENLAWNTLMYRIRFPRDLVKEANGIKVYLALYRRIPTTPFEWSVVRVLGYVR